MPEIEHQSLTPDQVISHVYYESEEQARQRGAIVKEVSKEFIGWASYSDGPATVDVYIDLEKGFIEKIWSGVGKITTLIGSRRDDYADFDRGLVVSSIQIGKRAITSADWFEQRNLSKLKSWGDISIDQIASKIRRARLAWGIFGRPGTAMLYTQQSRLFFSGMEVSRFADQPTVNIPYFTDLREWRPSWGENRKTPTYHPLVVKYLIDSLNSRIAIEDAEKQIRHDMRWYLIDTEAVPNFEI